jgi:hypothetical protein
MSVHPATYDDTIRTQAVYDMTLQFQDSNGNNIDLTGWTISAQIWNLTKTTQYATFSVNNSNAVTGTIVLSLTTTQTSSLPVGTAYYDVLLTNLSGRKEYYLKGTFYIQQGYST